MEKNEAGGTDRKQITVLVVDDELFILETRKAVLEREGYRVIVTSSPISALTILQQEEIDVVLLDFNMPEMKGDECAEEMRKIRQDVPIIFCIADPRDVPNQNRFGAPKHVKGCPEDTNQVLFERIHVMVGSKK